MAAKKPRPVAESVLPPESGAAEAVPAWIRVRDKDGVGHEYDVAGRSFDPDMHHKVNKPVQYPDLFGLDARPRAATYRTDKAGRPVTTENQEH